MRKSLKRFAAVLCAAVTMVSFSGTKVEAASGDGYWTVFRTDNLWHPNQNQYIHNRIETVGGEGWTARAKVKYSFYDYDVYQYRAAVKFIYAITAEREWGDFVLEDRKNVYKGEHEMIVDKDYEGHYYIAVRPTYGVWAFRDELPVSEVGMFYVRY